ncbi:S8 family serine peptidase [Synechocystis sp. LKSZ1]|uniref:S8 family serine peptidase n=1 Tax=Synechocystis sp. LKSZ1 TaxID=3144951 RepID=UPI00336C1292
MSSSVLTLAWIQEMAQSLESSRFNFKGTRDSGPAGSDFYALDDSLSSATPLTVGTTPTAVTGYVGWSDANDYYRFTLNATHNFALSLTGLSNAADVALLNSAGTILASSTLSGTSAEAIASQLTEGTYYVRVYNRSSWFRGTNYVLTVQGTPLVPPPPPPSPVDNAGNSLNEARNITLSPTTTNFSDYVGVEDTNDYYQFSLSKTSDFNLSLSGLVSDADVQLLDSNGNSLQTAQARGTGTESITQQLNTGTYYIRVYPYSGNTTYTLGLSATEVILPPPPPPPPADNAGNTLATARSITLSSTPTNFSDYVGAEDTNDYYRFSLSKTSDFNLSLSGLVSDADVQLLDSNGNSLQTAQARGTGTESITQQLSAGTYYIRVYPYSNSNTDYILGLSATEVVVSAPPPPPTVDTTANYSSTSGYGLINAAAAVASALGQSPFADVPTFGGANDWGANLIKAPEVWAQNYTGQGVIVAVLDTGVDRNHPDLNDNIWVNSGEIPGNGRDDDGNGYVDDVYGWNFASNNSNTLDGNGHGTHVAGTIAGERNDFGVTGIAYGAKIMPVKVLNDSGSGSLSNIAKGIRYAVDNGAKVLNLSLGGSSSSNELQSAVQYASSKGAIVVMAAGNSGTSQPIFPARYATSWGIAVGAVDQNNTMASFSNKAGSNSAMVFVDAPGVDIYSTRPNNSYTTLSGTSMATPHVAGVVALMLSAKASLTDAQVRKILMQTSGNVLTANSAGVGSLGTGSLSVQSLESLAVTDSNSSVFLSLSNATGPTQKNPMEPANIPGSPALIAEMTSFTPTETDSLFQVGNEADSLALWPTRYLDSQDAELLAPKLLAYG